LRDTDFVVGGLRVYSFARPGAKLFTAHQSLFVAEVGKLNWQAINRILAAVIRVIQANV
jgi:hypothetical protein